MLRVGFSTARKTKSLKKVLFELDRIVAKVGLALTIVVIEGLLRLNLVESL